MERERMVRVAANEAVFRELNAQLAGLAQEDEISCVCECGELDCVETLHMTRAAYVRLRSDRTTFAIRPGHAKPDVKDVVASYPGYEVVRKKEGLPARLARETAE